MKPTIINKLKYWITFPHQYLVCKIHYHRMSFLKQQKFKRDMEKYLKPLKGYFVKHNYRFLKRITGIN